MLLETPETEPRRRWTGNDLPFFNSFIPVAIGGNETEEAEPLANNRFTSVGFLEEARIWGFNLNLDVGFLGRPREGHVAASTVLDGSGL